MKIAVAPKVDKTYVDQIKADHENKISLLNTGKLSNPSDVALVMQNQYIKGCKNRQKRSRMSRQCLLLRTKQNLETRMAVVHGAVTTLSNIKRSNPAAKDLDMAFNEITGGNLGGQR